MSRVCHFYVIVMAHSADRQVTAVTYLFKAFEIRGNCWRSVWVDGCVFFFYSKSTYCVSSHLFRTLPHTHSICGGSLILDLGGHVFTGDSQPMDVCSVHHNNTFLRYSVSLLGYGFYGDVLADSERKRWMGPARYDFSGGSEE